MGNKAWRDPNERELLIKANVLPLLPSWRGPDGADKFPNANLIGATIVAIGMPDCWQKLEGGGLAIDYRPRGSRIIKRLLLAFNELGMWQESICKDS
jgi:hypothetical protein